MRPAASLDSFGTRRLTHVLSTNHPLPFCSCVFIVKPQAPDGRDFGEQRLAHVPVLHRHVTPHRLIHTDPCNSFLRSQMMPEGLVKISSSKRLATLRQILV